MTPGRPAAFDSAAARARLAGGPKKFWSSLEEIVDAPEFRQWIEAEFPAAAPLLIDRDRRHVLKLMGASLLLAGLAGCAEDPADLALPYVNQPENMLPGVARYFASAVPFSGYVQPVIATTHEGRPTKLDGNPEHPASRGASDAFTQAAVLQLYDPDRSRTPLRDSQPTTWQAFQHTLLGLRTEWGKRRGEGLHILTGDITSPTLIRQLEALRAEFPAARLHIDEPVGSGLRAAGLRLAFGRELDLHYRLQDCAVVVSLEDDLLGPSPHQVTHARAWSQRRGETPEGGRAVMHVAESIPSPTGTVAATRLICNASRIGELARAIAAELGIATNPNTSLSAPETRWIKRAAADLRAHAGHSLLAIGSHLPPAMQALAAQVNDRLGNGGSTVWYSEPITYRPADAGSLADLARDMAAGNVDTLLILDCNPVYTAPGDLEFTELLRRVGVRIHAGLHADETAQACGWHLPLTHALESWSDGRAVDGTVSLIQPLVAPLYGGRSGHQVIEMLSGRIDPAADAPVRETWMGRFGNDFEARWRQSLHDGFVTGTAAQQVTATPHPVEPPPAPQPRGAGAIDVAFRPDPCVWDGRFANVAWLQELPKPLSKLTWDNVIAVSPKLAERLHLSNGDTVEIAVADRRVRGPAWIMPGQAPDTVAVYLGYGRGAVGQVAAGIGYSAYPLRSASAPWLAAGSLQRVDGHQQLATTQMHHRMDGFDFVREVTAAQPNVPATAKPQPDIYPPWPSAGDAWGMVIDLDLCIGCNACIAACTAENNIPVVGKEQVAMGREMQWLRVDRYHTGSPDDPRFYLQPVPCMHCEKAPCEMGCPVHATVHSADGLNQMIYNRCIGTRTCSSYCPYKVRRFNWFDYRAPEDSPSHAAHNPDVTVRSRGVMEKCTYCVQRIQGARVAADKESRPIREGEVVTACQQACPTTAIVFGNLNDPASAVAKRRRSGRHYVLLEELGTRPRTSYLARRNDTPTDQEAT